jgi:putative transposase
MAAMARPLRIEKAGAWYHVTARGNERKNIFRDNKDRRHFLELVGQMAERFQVRIHVYVLMDNHYHVVLQLTETNLSRAVQWLNVSYSIWFNRRHGRSGHLFRGRFKSVLVNPEEWALALSCYVHLNPVRIYRMGLGKQDRQRQRIGLSSQPQAAQVRERLDRLRRYRWSSYRAYIGLEKPAEWLECEPVLESGGGKRLKRRRQYQAHVENAVREGLEKSPWESLREQVVLGGERFLAQLKNHIVGNRQEQRAAQRLLRARPGLKAVIAAVEQAKGEKWEEFRDRHGDRGRDMVLYLGRSVCGMKLMELAEAVGLNNYGVVAVNAKRYQVWLDKHRAEQSRMEQVLQMLNYEM